MSDERIEKIRRELERAIEFYDTGRVTGGGFHAALDFLDSLERTMAADLEHIFDLQDRIDSLERELEESRENELSEAMDRAAVHYGEVIRALERELEQTRTERDLHREGERLNAETARKTYAQLSAAREVMEATNAVPWERVVVPTRDVADALFRLHKARAHYDEVTISSARATPDAP